MPGTRIRKPKVDREALVRAYRDLVAYARHFETCDLHKKIVNAKGKKVPMPGCKCSCGLERAYLQCELALCVTPQARRRLRWEIQETYRNKDGSES